MASEQFVEQLEFRGPGEGPSPGCLLRITEQSRILVEAAELRNPLPAKDIDRWEQLSRETRCGSSRHEDQFTDALTQFLERFAPLRLSILYHVNLIADDEFGLQLLEESKPCPFFLFDIPEDVVIDDVGSLRSEVHGHVLRRLSGLQHFRSKVEVFPTLVLPLPLQSCGTYDDGRSTFEIEFFVAKALQRLPQSHIVGQQSPPFELPVNLSDTDNLIFVGPCFHLVPRY